VLDAPDDPKKTRQKRWQWAIDTATPDPERAASPTAASRSAPVPLALRRHQLLGQRAAVTAAIPSDPIPELSEVANQIHAVRRSIDDLRLGRGDYAETPAGSAGRDLTEAKSHQDEARRMAATPGVTRRDRRAWVENQAYWAQVQAEAQDRWDQHGAPELTRLTARLETFTVRHRGLVQADGGRRIWLAGHPELPRLLARIDRDIDSIDHALVAQRHHLDGQPASAQAVGETAQASWASGANRRRDNDVGL
jgi:hypothetical protein